MSLGGITKVLSDEVKSVVILSRCHSNFSVIPLTIDTSVKQLNYYNLNIFELSYCVAVHSSH